MALWSWAACTTLLVAQDVVRSPNSPSLTSAAATPSATLGITLTPRVLDFGEQAVGATSAALSASVRNAGNAKLTVTDIIPSGIDFRETDDCSAKLAPGAACTIQVKFTPAVTGLRNGSITILDSVSSHPQTLVLNGMGK